MIHNRYIIFSNLLLIVLLIAGFTLIEMNSVQQYYTVVNQQIENNLSRTALTVESDIEGYAAVQLAVASSMANDISVRSWLNKEPYSSTASIISYLEDRCDDFGYDTAFLISDKTHRLFNQHAYVKDLDLNDEYDSWYTKFTNSNKESEIIVNLDRANNYAVSLFADCRVEDRNGKLLGVIGTSMVLEGLWTHYDNIEKEMDQQIFITPLSSAPAVFNSSAGHYIQPSDLAFKLGMDEHMLQSATEDAIYTSIGNQRIFIKKLYSLDWAIVVTQKSVSLSESITAAMRSNSVYVILLSALLVLMSFLGMRRINRRLYQLENIDRMTGMPNQTLFTDQFKSLSASEFLKPCSFFTLTIDNYESMTEEMGTAYRNAILNIVSEELMKLTEQYGIVGRWEMREYIGWLTMSPENAHKLLLRLNLRLSEQDKKLPLHVSIGITDAHNTRSLPILAMQAERAMYRSKRNGCGLCTIYDPEIDGIVSIIASD